MFEENYREVCQSLVAIGYREHLSHESLPLVDKLLSDYLLTTENLKHAKHESQFLHQELANATSCMDNQKRTNDELLRQINSLQTRRTAASKGSAAPDTVNSDERDISQLIVDNGDMRFLLDQYRSQLTDAENRVHVLLQQQSEPRSCYSVSGERRAPSSGIGSGSETALSSCRQRLSTSHILDPSTKTAAVPPPPAVQPLDLLSAAERRIGVLEEQLQLASQQQNTAETTLHETLQLLRDRDSELARLRTSQPGSSSSRRQSSPPSSTRRSSDAGQQLLKPSVSCCDLPSQVGADSAADPSVVVGRRISEPRHRVPYTELKRRNQRLEKQLKDAVLSQHEAMQRALVLCTENEAVRAQLAESTRRADRLQREVDDLNSIAQALDADRHRLHHQHRSPDARQLPEERQQLQQERHQLQEEHHQLQEEHHQLQEEHRQLQEEQESPIPSSDEYRQSTVVAYTDRSCQTDSAAAADGQQLEGRMEELLDAVTASCQQGRLEREQLQRSVEEQRRGHHANSCAAEQLVKIYELQLADSARQAEKRSAQSDKLRRRLDEALRAIHRMSESLGSKSVGGALPSTAAADTGMAVPSSTSSVSTSCSRPADVRYAPTCTGDCQLVVSERDNLRHRLKLATEAQLADRQRLEGRLRELETLVEDAEREKSLLRAQSDSNRALVASLETQVANLQNSVQVSQTELNRLTSLRNKVRTVADRSESALKSCEGELIQTAKRLETRDRICSELETRCESLTSTTVDLKRQLSAQTGTVQSLINERDRLQNQLDESVETLDGRRQQIEHCQGLIHRLETTVADLESQLGSSRERAGDCEQRAADLQEQLRVSQSRVTALQAEREAMDAQNGRLQSDLASLTSEIRRLKQQEATADQQHEQLRTQVRDYVHEVARVEELLGMREEERNDLLRQYRDLTLEASGLEESNASMGCELGSLRAEIAAREKELEQARVIIDELNDDLQNVSVAKQHADSSTQRLQDTVGETSCRLERSVNDCERLERELNASRELCVKLDSDKELTSRQLAARDADVQQLRSDLAGVHTELESVQQQLRAERTGSKDLEGLLTATRERHRHSETSEQQRQQQFTLITDDNNKLHDKLETMRQNLDRAQTELSARDSETSRLQRQLTDERFEKERLGQEVQRLRKDLLLAGLPAAAAPYSPLGAAPIDTAAPYTAPASSSTYSPSIMSSVDRGTAVGGLYSRGLTAAAPYTARGAVYTAYDPPRVPPAGVSDSGLAADRLSSLQTSRVPSPGDHRLVTPPAPADRHRLVTERRAYDGSMRL